MVADPLIAYAIPWSLDEMMLINVFYKLVDHVIVP
ncbi:MAG: hypothetical protein LZF62_480310 [Nitrospira sp.]|nr:MAG: hypothetical protein LZF62_480310 [Nitrospira sp.]